MQTPSLQEEEYVKLKWSLEAVAVSIEDEEVECIFDCADFEDEEDVIVVLLVLVVIVVAVAVLEEEEEEEEEEEVAVAIEDKVEEPSFFFSSLFSIKMDAPFKLFTEFSFLSLSVVSSILLTVELLLLLLLLSSSSLLLLLLVNRIALIEEEDSELSSLSR